MKPASNYDFPITIIDRTRGEDPEDKVLYRNIFEVMLNFTISVTFVPFFERNKDNWPPDFSPTPHIEFNRAEALSDNAVYTEYCITPDLNSPGKVQNLKDLVPENEHDRVSKLVSQMFFVTLEQYKVFEKELEELAPQFSSVHSYKRVSELNNYNFVRFLLSNVIRPEYFSQWQLWLLARDQKVTTNE